MFIEHIHPGASRKLEELTASRSSRRRAWENLQEIRWVLKIPPAGSASAGRKTIDLEGRLVKDGVRKKPSWIRKPLWPTS